MDKIDKIEPDEISVKQLLSNFKSGIRYIKSKRLILLCFGLIGVLAGIIYSLMEYPTYKAVSTFVLEESGHNGGLNLGQYSSVASLAGIELGGGSEKGLFQGDNILELYRSRLMIEKTLLSPVEINGEKQLLINRYIKAKGIDTWKKQDHVENLNFNINPKKFSRLQDSIIREITMVQQSSRSKAG